MASGSKWIKTPKGYVAVTLVAFLVVAGFGGHDYKGFVQTLVAVAAAVAIDILFSMLLKKKRIVPDGALITGLIVGLILGTSTSEWIVAATSALAILSKYLLAYKKKPIFNPAATGLLLSIVLFHSGQSWWGSFADLPAWLTMVLLISGYFVINRVNKFPLVFVFLGVYLLLLLLMGLFHGGDAVDALRPPFIEAVLFFAFIMLTDPPTSPAKDKEQALFGLIASVVGSTIYAIYGGLAYLFIGLLSANAYHFLKTVRLAATKR